MKYIALCKVDNDIIIHGDECVTDLGGLYRALVQKDTTEIEIRKEFADKFFTYSALCDFVEYSSAVAPNVIIEVQETVYDNIMAAVRELSHFTSKDAMIYALESNPTFVLQTITTLIKHFVSSHDEQTVANNKIATLLVQIDSLQRELNKSKTKQDQLLEVNHDLDSKLTALVNRTNYRYEKTIKPDELFLAKHNSYNHILYIKEITRVHYTDTLVYYLQEIMRTMYGVPVRSIVIEPFYSYDRATLYPTYKPHWALTYQDVYSGDIFMAGYQPKLMNDLLQNANRVNFLIVLDRGGYVSPHITGSNVSTIYTVSDLKDAYEDIPLEDIISYSEDTMYIPYIEDFNELSPEQRIMKYSSMPVIKKLVGLLEEAK